MQVDRLGGEARCDPRVTPYLDLRDGDLLRQGPEGGWFIGEQALVIEKMLARPAMTESILASERQLERAIGLVEAGADAAAGVAVPILVADDALLAAIVGFPLHRGLLALGRRPTDGAARIEAAVAAAMTDRARPVLLLACEEIRNIDNIGMLFRNAAAFGVDGVLLSPGCHDPLYRKSLRVSIGHALEIPFWRVDPWPDGLAEVARRWDLALLATSTRPEATAIHDLTPPRRAILAVGSEFPGISPDLAGGSAALVRVPMAPGVDSLNVAVAAGICLSWLARGRLGPNPASP